MDASAGGCLPGSACDPEAPEDDALLSPSPVDTSDLDPCAGACGSDGSCIRYPTPTPVFTQYEHRNLAVDLACSAGDTLINPFPVTARVSAVDTSSTGRYCFDNINDYNNTCRSRGACNSKIELQATYGGQTYRALFLHIAGSGLRVGDTVEAFAPVAICGDVGWTCGSPAHHLHFALRNDSSGTWISPRDQLNPTCDAVAPPTDLCAGVSCGPNGACNPADGGCACNAGWEGPRCEREIGPGDPCAGVSCGPNGSCSGGACVCDPGWEGPRCESESTPDCTTGVTPTGWTDPTRTTSIIRAQGRLRGTTLAIEVRKWNDEAIALDGDLLVYDDTGRRVAREGYHTGDRVIYVNVDVSSYLSGRRHFWVVAQGPDSSCNPSGSSGPHCNWADLIGISNRCGDGHLCLETTCR